MTLLATLLRTLRLVRIARLLRRLMGRGPVVLGLVLLLLVGGAGLAAPWLTALDPSAIQPAARNRPPGAQITVRNDDGERTTVTAVLGTDTLGRDLLARVLYGARISLAVGAAAVAVGLLAGTFLGLLAGWFRGLDALVMRMMDGLMAIPAVLLAIALVAAAGASLATVIVAIAIPEVPRVVRLVRACVLGVREEPYVEAAIACGTPVHRVLWRHVLPALGGPLTVQATHIAASAILLEAILSFLGVGLPPDIPTWGNIIAEGRSIFQLHPQNILWPGLLLCLTVLAIHLLGDGLRDALDARQSRPLDDVLP